MDLSDLKKLNETPITTEPLPVLFIGHGSPMNGIVDNEFSERWKGMGREIPKPKAVLCISAHWLTNGTCATAMLQPKTIHDFGGFAPELYDIQYPAPGSPVLAEETRKLVTTTSVGLDHDWGLDHGTWTVVRRMYPDADIPVIQLSIDYPKPAQHHYDLAQQLAGLRSKGILIIGSGNMVHNLGMIDFRNLDTPGFGFDWALEMNEIFKQKILDGDHRALIDYASLDRAAKLAVPTPDHYYPLMYVLAMRRKNDSVQLFNDKAVGGSLTMTSVKFG